MLSFSTKGYHKRKAYIATQGPLPDTQDDFWRLVWEHKCATIVMLTKEREGGRVCPDTVDEYFSITKRCLFLNRSSATATGP